MLEFIKKNKKIILSSSIFTGISSNNIYCGCCGDKNNDTNNNNNPTQNPPQNPQKDEKPDTQNPPTQNPQKDKPNPGENPPTQDETERNKIISECENLIVEIKNLKNDYAKTVDKNDTIENLKNFKTELQTDLNTFKNTKPGENPEPKPEKNEKEKSIEEIKKITEDGIKKATEKDKKMIKYLYFNKDISKTDEELINEMNNKLNLSSRDINNLKELKINLPNYWKNRIYKKDLISRKINEFNFEINNKTDANFTLDKIFDKTNDSFRKNFFKEENNTEDSVEDKIKIYTYVDNSDFSIYYYCYFNESIYDKLKNKEDIAELQKYIEGKQHGLYFFCKYYDAKYNEFSENLFSKRSFKYEINENLDLTIKMK